jgi:hypothetical protein
VIFTLFGAPFPDLFGGLAVGVWALISGAALLIGALLGGSLVPSRGGVSLRVR